MLHNSLNPKVLVAVDRVSSLSYALLVLTDVNEEGLAAKSKFRTFPTAT